MRSLLFVSAMGLLSFALGERCFVELEQTFSSLNVDVSESVIAAELLATAVHWVEPALPPLVSSAEVPLEPGDPGYDAVRYLTERRLLPESWQAGELSAATWEQMLSRFLAWYGLPAWEVRSEPAREQLVADLAAALGQVGESVRPLALVASSANDRTEIAFLGVVWNWTVYPRLIIRRPAPGQTLAGGVKPLLEQLGNCVVRVEHYVYAQEETARRLFLSHADARMYVIGSEPELQAWPLLVPDGEEDAYFAFSAAQVSGLAAYAAAFDGGQLGITSLMTMLPSLRTNVPPNRIPGLLRTPYAQ
jgi:hypothetical protein